MSDSDDDYMSDKLLLGCEKEDIRPGLLFNKTQKRTHEIYKQQQEARFKKPKRYHEQEQEVRDKGLSTAISEDNKGFQLLQKMGYKSGSGLGKEASGISKPIEIKLQQGNTGLGTESHKKEVAKRKQDLKTNSNKVCLETFLTSNAEKRNLVRLQKDYYKAQKICEELDFKNDVKEPIKEYFWTRQTILAKKKKERSKDVDSEEESEEEEEEEQISEDFLNDIILYIRNVYSYCIYCADFVDSGSEDQQSECPGLYRQDHEDL